MTMLFYSLSFHLSAAAPALVLCLQFNTQLVGDIRLRFCTSNRRFCVIEHSARLIWCCHLKLLLQLCIVQAHRLCHPFCRQACFFVVQDFSILTMLECVFVVAYDIVLRGTDILKYGHTVFAVSDIHRIRSKRWKLKPGAKLRCWSKSVQWRANEKVHMNKSEKAENKKNSTNEE